jgi:hypothetical protein
MTKRSDYKIKSHYTTLEPTTEKFKVVLGGETVAVRKTVEAAQQLIDNLEKDPWFLDRGYTRVDRCKA